VVTPNAPSAGSAEPSSAFAKHDGRASNVHTNASPTTVAPSPPPPAAPAPAMTPESVDRMKVADLKAALKERGLEENGLKALLQARLKEALGLTGRVRPTLQQAGEARTRFDDEMNRDVVGMEGLKDSLAVILDAAEHDAYCAADGFGGEKPNLNMVFMGPPGTGKTEMAKRIGKALHGMGVVKSDVFIEANKETLLGQYSNQIGQNVTELVNRARGGVLFIDEVYALIQGEESHGTEVVDALVPLVSKNRGDIVFIVAGYEVETVAFFESNQGLARRFPSTGWVGFDSYTTAQLMEIARRRVERMGLQLADDEAERELGRLVQIVHDDPSPSNAGGVVEAISSVHVRYKARMTRTRREHGDDEYERVKGKIVAADVARVREQSEAAVQMRRSAHTSEDNGV